MSEYILDENNNTIPVTWEEYSSWSKANEGKDRRRVGYAESNTRQVSTVFLAIDHNHHGREPILFESMVFDENGDDIFCDRYHTWEEAEAGHKRLCELYEAVEMRHGVPKDAVFIWLSS